MKLSVVMKFLVPAVVMAFFLLSSFVNQRLPGEQASVSGENLVVPEDVMAILEHSCVGCHNSESQSDKAREKLSFDELNSLSKSKIVAKLDDIDAVIGKNEMPPEKFLAKYPDRALTAEQSKRLQEWARTTAEELMK